MENSSEFARPPGGVSQEDGRRPYAERHINGLLSEGDYLALLRSIEVISACTSAEEFPACVIREAARLVPCNLAGYNEVHLRDGRMIAVVEPSMPRFEKQLLPKFEALMHEHPIIRYSNRTGDGQTLKISDFLSREDYHESSLYQEVYRLIGAEDQIAFSVMPEKDVVIGIALNRPHADFTERDRRILNLLRPHIIQAYANLQRLALRDEERESLHRAFLALGRGLIAVDENGEVLHSTPGAMDSLWRHLPGPLTNPPRLPKALADWLRAAEAPPFVAEHDESRLIIRLVRNGGRLLLLLAEEPPEKSPLAAYKLTPRETEVLRWVAEGKANADIASILRIAPATVKLHVEHILEKLGVENRTAAALLAHENGIGLRNVRNP